MNQTVKEFDRASLKSAKAALVDASQPALDTARQSAAAANDFVRANPWAAVGLGILAGALLGFAAAKR